MLRLLRSVLAGTISALRDRRDLALETRKGLSLVTATSPCVSRSGHR